MFAEPHARTRIHAFTTYTYFDSDTQYYAGRRSADGPDVEMAQSREHATEPLVYEPCMDADSTVQSYKV